MLAGKGATISTPLSTLGKQILNAKTCMEGMQKEGIAEIAVRSLIKVLDSYDRVVNHGWKIQLEEVSGRKQIARQWMERVYFVLLSGISQNLNSREEEMEMPPPTDALSVLTIHKAKGLEFPVVAVVVDKVNQAFPDAAHHLEEDVLPFRQDFENDIERVLGGTKEERALQDIVRRHYVAYSRAQWILLLLVPDQYMETSPPAIGLGKDAEWFRNHVQEYPPRKGVKGATQDALW